MSDDQESLDVPEEVEAPELQVLNESYENQSNNREAQED